MRQTLHYVNSRGFSEDELSVLVAFNRSAIQNMYTQTSFSCRWFPHVLDGYDKIDTETLADVLINNEYDIREVVRLVTGMIP